MDRVGFIDCYDGEIIGNRYKIENVAGKGRFGTVFNVFDKKRKRKVALKVIRCIPSYRESAWEEAAILKHIRKKDPDQKSECVRMFSVCTIMHYGRKHVCMGFEKLGVNLYDFTKANKGRKFNWGDIQAIAKQLLHALTFCKSLNMVHTDIKPENILLESSDYYLCGKRRIPVSNKIRLIDFGCATYMTRPKKKYIINTRYYRGPEVILKSGWSFPSDVWSVGCTLAELRLGYTLFYEEEDDKHLEEMQTVMGNKFPVYMKEGVPIEDDGETIDKLFKDEVGFVELLKGLLEFDPKKRLSAEEALKQAWVAKRK